MKLFMKNAVGLGVSVLAVLLLQAGPGFGEDETKLNSPATVPSGATANETAILTQAPVVPAPIKRRVPAKVTVNLEVKEITKRLADGVEYPFWTFGGDVPGNFIRIREGDEVEFHLQ